MAITNPAQNTTYCRSTGGARLEYQTPVRNIPPDRYPWTGHTFTTVPIKFTITGTPGALVESLTVSPDGSAGGSVTLTADTNYLLVVSGTVDLSGNTIDGLYEYNPTIARIIPSSRLTTDDPDFGTIFYSKALSGEIPYTSAHSYTLDFTGNGVPLTINLASGGIGSITVAIYQSSYRLQVTDSSGLTTYLDTTRNQPFYGLNIACGGDCPTRTSYSCQCGATVSCYWDDQTGMLSKIFEADR